VIRKRIEILGVLVDAVSSDDLLAAVSDAIERKAKMVYAYANVHTVNLAQESESLRAFLNDADITYPDGEGLRVAARLLGGEFPPPTGLTRWIWRLAEHCEAKGYSIYLLGGIEGAAEQASANLRTRFPRLKIVGTRHGYFRDDESEGIVEGVNSSNSNVLLVGFGTPRQEAWIEQWREQLKVNVIFPAGSAIEYAAGIRNPAPEWASRLGIEWIFRLAAEPGRLFGRYVFGNPKFLWSVMNQRMAAKNFTKNG